MAEKSAASSRAALSSMPSSVPRMMLRWTTMANGPSGPSRRRAGSSNQRWSIVFRQGYSRRKPTPSRDHQTETAGHLDRALAIGRAGVNVISPDVSTGIAAVVRDEAPPLDVRGDDCALAVDDGDRVFRSVQCLPEVR